jgi:acyl-CoA synthetase (AMP-forming)/AMP-acid ligase II
MDIAKRFQDAAKRFPQKPFIIFKDRPITYQEAAEKVNKLANALHKEGITKGDKVAIYLPNSPEYIVSYLAVFSIGAACIPLDTRLTDEELIGILNHSEAAIFISKPLRELSFAELVKQVPGLKNIIKCWNNGQGRFLNFAQIMQEDFSQELNVKIEEENLALLYYTSGTTGRSKAVMSNYRSLDNAPQTIKFFGVELGGVEICALPLSHIGGFIYIQLALEFVMTLVLMERFIPLEFLKSVEKHRASWFHLVPAMFTALLQLKEFEKFDLSSIKGVDVFGAPSHPSLIQRFGQCCPNARLWHGWGMTETAAPNTVTDQEHIASVGKAPPWFEVRIFDNNDQELPLGEVGEIVCRGWPIMMGYYKEPEMTAEIMRNGWLHTGDLGTMDKDGYLYIKGRKKDMIIVGGLNVYSAEVEHVIAEHPKVKEVAVVGTPDKLRGEAVKAVVVLKEGERISDTDIKAFCRERLIHFKIPQIIEFREFLPKTSSGKVQKGLLKENSALAKEQV